MECPKRDYYTLSTYYPRIPFICISPVGGICQLGRALHRYHIPIPKDAITLGFPMMVFKTEDIVKLSAPSGTTG